MRGRFLLVPIVALVLAQPTIAFNAEKNVTRDVVATIATDTLAYTGLTIANPCVVNRLVGGTCTFTITNGSPKAQKYSVTKTLDADGRVSTYQVTGGSSVSSGPTTTASDVAVGTPVTLTATIGACPICTLDTNIDWRVDGAKANVIDSTRPGFRMVLTWS